MTDVNALLAMANAAAETAVDMSEATSGGGSSRLLPEGTAFAILAGVTEIGRHPQFYKGQAKDPADEIILTFALVGVGMNGERYNNEDGSPYIHECYPMAVTRTEKSKAFKMFAKMNWQKTAKSFAQLLGRMWLLPVRHKPKSPTDSTPVYFLDFEAMSAPIEAMSGSMYKTPDIDPKLYKLFLWDVPTLECWDSLYVAGTWDDGTTRNRTQENIAAALNFNGSPIQNLLLTSGRPVPNPRPRRQQPAAGSPAAAPAAPLAAPPVAQAPIAAPAVPVAPAAVPAAPVAAPIATPAQPAPGVAAPAPFAPPAAAVAVPVAPPQTPTSTVPQSATPAGTSTTSPSSPPAFVPPALPAVPGT